MGNAQLVSFWGGPVTWVERLCTASMLRQGHPIAIYTYEPEEMAKLDLGAEIRDAREVIPESDPIQRYREAKRFAMFANLFRLALQQQSRGIWVDLDCYMLKPLVPASDFVFGFSSAKKLNNAVLRLPAGCPMINDYMRAITADPLRTPWSTFRRRIQRDVEILFGRSQPKTSVRSNIGPRALTYFARKHDVIKHAMPLPVFYAILNRETKLLAEPDDPISAKLPPEAVMVHLWRGRIKHLGLLAETPTGSSYLGKACREYGIAP